MTYIKDSLLEPYFIECAGIQYIVRKDTSKISAKTGKLVENKKAEGYMSNKYAAYKLIVRLKLESGEDTKDLVRTIQEDNKANVEMFRELIEKLG